MNASSLSGECAKRSANVVGDAAGVDMFVSVLVLTESADRRIGAGKNGRPRAVVLAAMP